MLVQRLTDSFSNTQFIAPDDGKLDPTVLDISFGPSYRDSRRLQQINIFHGWFGGARTPYDLDIGYSTTGFPNVFEPIVTVKDLTADDRTLIQTMFESDEVTNVDTIRLVIRPIQNGSRWIGHSFAEIDVNFFQPVPESSTLALLSMGAISLLAYAWRRRRR